MVFVRSVDIQRGDEDRRHRMGIDREWWTDEPILRQPMIRAARYFAAGQQRVVCGPVGSHGVCEAPANVIGMHASTRGYLHFQMDPAGPWKVLCKLRKHVPALR